MLCNGYRDNYLPSWCDKIILGLSYKLTDHLNIMVILYEIILLLENNKCIKSNRIKFKHIYNIKNKKWIIENVKWIIENVKWIIENVYFYGKLAWSLHYPLSSDEQREEWNLNDTVFFCGVLTTGGTITLSGIGIVNVLRKYAGFILSITIVSCLPLRII